MSFLSSVNNVISLAIIIIFLRSFPLLFDALARAAAVFALIRIYDSVKSLHRMYFLNSRISPKNKAVFITGCDSGIGYLVAQRLDQLGYHVFAACQFPNGEGALTLKNRTSLKLQILGLDVTDPQSVEGALDFVKKNLKNNEVLWAVVNNAGIGQAGEVEWTSMEVLSRVYEVNTAGTMRVTKAFLSLIRQSKGRIVNNTSLCGRFTCPGYVGYCVSKNAAIAFTTGLRMEMVKWGVKVVSVEAFFYTTPLTKAEPVLEMVENTFNKAPKDIREVYGEKYFSAFKESCRKLIAKSSPHTGEVVQSFEDAITLEEPETEYFPCYLPHKIILKLARLLPSSIIESAQLTQMPRSIKPAELCR